MHIEDLMTLLRLYTRLGGAVQSQLDDMLNGEDASQQNPAAVREIKHLLEEAKKLGVTEVDVYLEDIATVLG